MNNARASRSDAVEMPDLGESTAVNPWRSAELPNCDVAVDCLLEASIRICEVSGEAAFGGVLALCISSCR